MNISQGLRQVSTLKEKIKQYTTYLQNNATWEEGEDPIYPFFEILCKRTEAVREMASLQARVAAANATNTIEYEGNKITLSHAVKLLSELKASISLLNVLTSNKTETNTVNSVTWEPDPEDYSKRVRIEKTTTTHYALIHRDKAEMLEKLKEQFQILNDQVEAANHRITIP